MWNCRPSWQPYLILGLLWHPPVLDSMTQKTHIFLDIKFVFLGLILRYLLATWNCHTSWQPFLNFRAAMRSNTIYIIRNGFLDPENIFLDTRFVFLGLILRYLVATWNCRPSWQPYWILELLQNPTIFILSEMDSLAQKTYS